MRLRGSGSFLRPFSIARPSAGEPRQPKVRQPDWLSSTSRRRAWLWLLGAMCLSVTAAGCGSGDSLNRKAISGTVTVDGRPVPNGSVSFEPLMAGGVGSGAVITEGKYTIEKKDGLPPGKYRVRITGDEGVVFGVSEGKMPGDEIMPPRKSLVPANWNSNSKEEIEVKDDGPFVFDFPITTKKK